MRRGASTLSAHSRQPRPKRSRNSTAARPSPCMSAPARRRRGERLSDGDRAGDQKYIPGNPNIVVSHMPGAGGIKAATYIESVGPQDGTAWGFITRGFMLAPLLKLPQANFQPRNSTGSAVPRALSRWAWSGTRNAGAHHPGRHAEGSRGRRHLDRARTPASSRARSTASSAPSSRSSPAMPGSAPSTSRWSAARCKARSARPGSRSTAARASIGCPTRSSR